MTAVVILHYNRIQLTADCCASLLEQTVAPSQIIVVDNASPDHSSADLAVALPPICRITRTSSNFGFSGGMNVGIREALNTPETDSVLLLNNDTRCPPQLVEKLREQLATAPGIGIVGCDMEGTAGGGDMPAAYRLSPFFAFPVPVADASKGTPFDYLQGSCLLIRRKVFDDIGLLDESFFFFCEDADFCLRARRAGWELAVAPNVKLFHLGSATITVTTDDGGKTDKCVVTVKNSIDVTVKANLQTDGNKGAPANLNSKKVKLVLTVKQNGVTYKSQELEVDMNTLSGQKESSLVFKFPVGTPAFVWGAEVSLKGFSGSVKDNNNKTYQISGIADINGKGEISLTLDFKKKSDSKISHGYPAWNLPEDEIGAYHIDPVTGQKEYLIFQTYGICMKFMENEEYCATYEHCYHKPEVNYEINWKK